MPQHIIGNLPVIYPYDTQVIAIGGAAVPSTSLRTQTIRLYATSACHIAIGANPTATSNDAFIPAGVIEYFMCEYNDLLSVIQDSAGGFLYITRHV